MRCRLFLHRFRLTGLNLERFINLMHQQGIPLHRIRRQDAKTLICECCSCDLPAVFSAAAEKGWRMEVLGPLGLSALSRRLQERPGIPVGIVLMLVCTMVLSRFVWRIDIRNAGTYHADIVSFLQESGYHTGIQRRHVDAEALENALIYRYPQLAWFHVHVSNVTLIVEVFPGVAKPEIPENSPGNVIAARDGIIHSIRTYAGTPAVEPGKLVRNGDVLIRGEERSYDGGLKAVRADGAVLARCWDSFSAAIPLYEIRSAETGRETVFNRIETPWFAWPPTQESPAYLASNLYLAEWPLGGAFFPVHLQRFTCREVSMEYALRDPEEVRAEAYEAAAAQLKKTATDNEIIDKWVDYCMIEDDTLAATVTVERLVDIGAFSSP